MINESDFVFINFIGKILQTGKIFDLNYKDLAEKEGIKSENMKFEPILVVPNAKYTLSVISKSVVGKEVGDKYTLDIKPKEGFGDFNPKLVRTFSLNTFMENRINPSVGDVVALDDKIATVMSVSGGRVMVNFNHPLAGKDLRYEIEIIKKIESDNDKCDAIFTHYVGSKPQSVEISGNNIKIAYSGDVQKYVADAISTDIVKYINKEFKVEITKS